MMGDFHPLQRVADGPSPSLETIGVAVDGSMSPDPSLIYFAWLLIAYNKSGNGDQGSRDVKRRLEISVCVDSEAAKHIDSGN
jgi:hypothetical protein